MISIGETVSWIENGKVRTGKVVGRQNDFRGKYTGYWKIVPTADQSTAFVVKHQRADRICGLDLPV